VIFLDQEKYTVHQIVTECKGKNIAISISKLNFLINGTVRANCSKDIYPFSERPNALLRPDCPKIKKKDICLLIKKVTPIYRNHNVFALSMSLDALEYLKYEKKMHE